MIRIGKIRSTHGLKGEVKVKNLSDFDRFSPSSVVFVVMDGREQELVVERARPQKDLLIVKFRGLDAIEDILPYKGLDLYTKEDASLQLAEDEFLFADLIGKKVIDNGRTVGHVTAVIPVPQGHILEVKDGDRKALIPFVKAFIGPITDDSIVIYPIEGML
ncbi:MAG: ribosome maturation factor RimM [Acholeplasmataceae bacterium]